MSGSMSDVVQVVRDHESTFRHPGRLLSIELESDFLLVILKHEIYLDSAHQHQRIALSAVALLIRSKHRQLY